LVAKIGGNPETGKNMGRRERLFEGHPAVRPATGWGSPLSRPGVPKRSRAPVTLPAFRFMQEDAALKEAALKLTFEDLRRAIRPFEKQ
jgi:hypothetical protein